MKHSIKTYALFLLIGAFTIGCKSSVKLPISDPMQNFVLDLSRLSSDEMEGRETGTKGEKLAASYIAERMEEIGLAPKGTKKYYQDFSKQLRSNPHDDMPAPNDPSITGRNVIGFINNGASNTVVIGAHYDHLGFGKEGSLYNGRPAIHNGADDNASGVTILLNLANALIENEYTNNNYLIIAFSGEEKGLWGSNYFVNNPTIDLASINYMINLDMVGRLNEDRQMALNGYGTSPLWSVTDDIKKPKFKIKKTLSGVGPSDHTSFYLKDIPVLMFFTGQHEHYHRPGDDIEHINFSGMRDIHLYIYTLISKLDKKGKLPFTKTVDESADTPDFKVTLGVVPDYLYDGKGMKIDGVREGKTAFKSDIQDGDIVIKMGEFEVVDMNSYMQCLSKFEPGSTTTVVIMRKGKEIEKKVTFD